MCRQIIKKINREKLAESRTMGERECAKNTKTKEHQKCYNNNQIKA